MSKKQQSKQKSSKKNKQQSQQQKQQQVPKYKCPNGKPALFLCKSSKCKVVAIKCIQTNNCNTCKKAHETCSHEIRISEMLKIAEKLQKKAPITQYKKEHKDEDLIQRMEKELAQIKKKYLNMGRQKWGITVQEAELIFDKKMEGQKSMTLYEISKQKTIYPETRFYLPPQFRLEAHKLYEKIKKFNNTVFKLHEIYKQLASIDCRIKFLQQNKNKANSKALDKIHKQFRTIIDKRIINIAEAGAGAEKQPLDKQKQDFKYIADRIFNLLVDEVKNAFNRNKFKQVLEMIELVFDLFHKNRKWFALNWEEQARELKNLERLKGIANYQMGQYQQSYIYYSALDPSSLTKQQLQKLVNLTQILKKSPQQKLKYLHLFEQKYSKNKAIFLKIFACYEELNNQDNIYTYLKKIIEIQFEESKTWIGSTNYYYQDFTTFLKRYQFCVRFEEKRRDIRIMLRTIGDALNKIDDRKEYINQEHMRIGLWLRYRMVLHHRQSYVNYYESAETANKKCQQYLKIINKWREQRLIDQARKQKIFKQIKQFQYRFLLIEAQGRKDRKSQFDLYLHAKNICDQLKLKIFEPVYQIARLSFDFNNDDAQDWQDQALKIYPTSTCYRNKSILLYQKYVTGKGTDSSLLRRSINCIDNSLSLDPTQTYLYHIRGTVQQNLGNFQLSNADFQKVPIDNDNIRFDINRRTAQNNQFIVKAAPAHPQRQQLLEKALNLYDICLNASPDDQRCIFGHARVLKLLKKFTLAEQQFNRLKDNSEYKTQIRMYLGNIKEQLATINGERDFGLLEEALKLYKQAGQVSENYDNLIRIYKQLDDETEAKKLEQKFRL